MTRPIQYDQGHYCLAVPVCVLLLSRLLPLEYESNRKILRFQSVFFGGHPKGKHYIDPALGPYQFTE